MSDKVLLIIRDGRGFSEKEYGNAILKANTPNDDFYIENYPHCLLKCTWNDVGNPEGVQWGSEVWHLTIWAGRVVWQPYELINQEIKNWWFFQNKVLIGAIDNCKKNNSDLHISGLFSDQWIHADFLHMFAILDLCKQQNFDRVFLHLVTDWRDVPEKSALKFLEKIEKKISELNIWKIASISGRFYSMDRDNNRDRTLQAYNAMALWEWFKSDSAKKAILEAYDRWDKTDYYIKPIVITDENQVPVWLVKDKDSFIWYNFRTDRSMQITAIFNWLDYCPLKDFKKVNIHYVCFSQYDDSRTLPVAFPQLEVENNLWEVLSYNWLKQLRIAETEKFAHVTFFFNSQKNAVSKWEERIMVNSPKVDSYDQKPEMSAYELTDKVLEQIWKFDFIVLNYANPDLVWHSWVFSAVVKACEVVDECVWKVVKRAQENWYNVLLMADHWNAENMLYENWEPDSSHGFNPVRLSLISDQNLKLKDGGMKDVAPTVLDLMWIEKPIQMTGISLIEK